ncbi:MAG: hypothetical protein J4215_05040 [Candidatus Diapherotrites archaeon]|uniref:PEP-utilising enzyme mobile domain-containing protein n=1 Tax=Candidatus Iainarchaeum sp. TaxID=3101447 RepID=A0A8T4L8R1_9ARCH|nr:hypothetical protein [Candidatus Diapherotrites archaeon]
MENLVKVYSSSAPPFPTGVMASSYNQTMDRSLGVPMAFSGFFCLIENGQSTWYWLPDQMETVANAVVERLSHQRGIIEPLRNNFLRNAKQLLELIDPAVLNERLENFSDADLETLFNEAVRIYIESEYWTEPANFSLEIRGHQLVQDRLAVFLAKENKNFKKSEIAEIFSVLANPVHKSFVARAEESLLAISLIKEEDRKKEAIRLHAKRFYFLTYDYYGPILDEKMVHEELDCLQAIPVSERKKRIFDFEHLEENASKRLREIQNRTNLPLELEILFENIRQIAFLYGDLKKERISIANVGFGRLLEEIGKRRNISERELHYATVSELQNIIRGDGPKAAELSKRIEKSAFIVENGAYRFLSESEIADLEKKISKKTDFEHQVMKGTAASPGIFVGRARVLLNSREISLFKAGEVLITTMTSVEFVPAMKKAGAIVTELGGITCHAAIISRELGKPCVIGTGNATKAIQTGDLIEVNANHGIIRKVGDDR